MPLLTRETLCAEAVQFSITESIYPEPSLRDAARTLYRVTDGKAVGTYVEHKFRAYLKIKYEFQAGNSASGIDFPGLLVDMKVTSIRQPQSSCPFKSAFIRVHLRSSAVNYSLFPNECNKSNITILPPPIALQTPSLSNLKIYL